jgi:predicted acyltransferase
MGIAFCAGLGFYFLVTGVNLIATTPTYVPVVKNGTLAGYTIAPNGGPPFNPIAIMLFVVGGILTLALGVEFSADLSDSKNQETTQSIAVLATSATTLTVAIQNLKDMTDEMLKKSQGQGQKAGPPGTAS